MGKINGVRWGSQKTSSKPRGWLWWIASNTSFLRILKKPSGPNNSLFLAVLFSLLLGGVVLLFHFIWVPFKTTEKEVWVQRLRNPLAFISAESSSEIPESLPGASQLA